MPIQPVLAEVPEPVTVAKGSRRTVTPEDAALMKANRGKWFAVETRLSSAVAAARNIYTLRDSLIGWYGGKWAVTRDGVKMLVRYEGE